MNCQLVITADGMYLTRSIELTAELLERLARNGEPIDFGGKLVIPGQVAP